MNYWKILYFVLGKLGLWIMAAKFEFEVMVSPSSARSLFQRALRLMPQEKKLWLEVYSYI